MFHFKGRSFARDCLCCPATGPLTATAVDRRSFLAGGTAAFGAMAAPAVLGLSAASAQAKPHRIDVHHHIVPPTWLDAMEIIGRNDSAAGELVGAEDARRHGQGRRRRSP